MSKYIKKPEVTKTNFKMYKDGKHWVFAGLMLLSVPMALMGSLEVSAAADDKTKKSVSTTVGDAEEDTISTASIEAPSIKATETTTNNEETVATNKVETEATTANLQPMLATTKSDAIAEINKLPNLSAAQKKFYVDKINNLGILDKLPLVGSSPKWFLAQAEATNAVYGNKNLTDADKKKFDAQISAATVAIPLLEDSYATLKWIEKRATLLEQVRTTPKITTAEKDNLAQQIYLGETASALDGTIVKAKAASQVHLLGNLTDDDKVKINNKILAAKSDAEVAKWSKNAEHMNNIRGNKALTDPDMNVLVGQVLADDAAMAEKRADAIGNVRTAPNMITDDKTALRQKMITATDGMLTLHVNQSNLVDSIRGNQSLLSGDKDALVSQALASSKQADVDLVTKKVSSATTVRENKTLSETERNTMVKLIIDGSSDNAVNFATSKANAITKIQQMKLSDSEKSKLSAAITAATTDAEVKELLDKAAAMQEVRGRAIDEAEKNTLNEGAFKAVKDGGSLILGWGKVTVEDQLNAAKGKAEMIEEVRGMKFLTQPEKNAIAKTILEAGKKDIADFEMLRAKTINDMRGMEGLTNEDKNALAAKMMAAKDSLDLALLVGKAGQVQKLRTTYTDLKPEHMTKFVNDTINSASEADYEWLEKHADAFNQLQVMKALTESERAIFRADVLKAKDAKGIQAVLDRAAKLNKEMEALGGSQLDLDITKDVNVEKPKTDRNIRLDSLSIRYVPKNKDSKKDGKVMLNAHIRVPLGLNLMQLLTDEGIYLEAQHKLGTNFEVTFLSNGQEMTLEYIPEGSNAGFGYWRMKSGGLLVLSGDEDIEIRMTFTPKDLDENAYIVIGYRRDRNPLESLLGWGIDDKIIIRFGKAAADINNMHEANEIIEDLLEGGVTDLEQEKLDELRDELNNIKDSDELKDVLDKLKEVKELSDAKNNAKDEINKLHNLSDKEKQEFLDLVEKGKTVEEIKGFLDQAKQQDLDNLNAAKKEAKDAIDALPNLTDAQKEDFKNQIQGLDKIVDMHPILDKALEQDAQNLKAEQDRANKNITDHMTNLKDNQKKSFIDRINNAKTVEEVKAIEKEAQALNDKIKAVEDKLNSGDLDLHDLELEKLIEDLGKVTTEAEADKILEEAEALDAKNKAEAEALKQAQDAAKDAIDKLDYLTEDEKQKFKDMVDQASDLQEVSDIQTNAQTQNDKNKLIVDKGCARCQGCYR